MFCEALAKRCKNKVKTNNNILMYQIRSCEDPKEEDALKQVVIDKNQDSWDPWTLLRT